MEKKFNLKNILPIAIGILGIFILVFSGISGNSVKKDGNENQTFLQEDIETYTENLEKKIKSLCESCSGVSNVSVAITLEGGFEYEYAKNEEYGDNSYGNNRSEEILVIGQGSNQQCVLLRKKFPVVSGVGIVCSGAENEYIKTELIMLVSSTLNVGINKIYITAAS